MITEAAEKLAQKQDLTSDEMQTVMEEIMTGQTDTAQVVEFLERLSAKGETVDEITAAARVMCAHSVKISAARDVIVDTCGTGGDCKGTFNVSTAAAFVIAGCGVTVAKHGNRSVSSPCGSADILEAVGVKIALPKEKIERCLDQIGIAFLFAPGLHPAMKHAMPARKQIGKRTVFNILGPLCNPAKATHQLIGVFTPALTQVIAQVAGNLGSKRAMVVHGKDGLDEITTTDATFVSEFAGGTVSTYEIAPEDFGLRRADPVDLLGGDVDDNIQILLEVLNGKTGFYRDITALNAAAALYVAEKARDIREGIEAALESIDSGKALKKLALLKQMSNEKD
ncbi:MAG: anthranilate phosphoribosyltransferase [Candidatus Omnitrophica bacterium]|nr:anthranilate phosphoribosyltransferase [Candidatus Omnitrophota bacterium]